jgi:integrase
MAKQADISKTDAAFICKELQRRGFLKTFIMADSRQAVDFSAFLENFWDYDNSPYVKEKLRKNHGIHRRHCIGQAGAVKKYWAPFFEGKLLGELTRQTIEQFIDHLETKNISALRKNKIIKAGTVALKWAYRKELIDKDIAQGITLFSGRGAERQILSPELAAAVFKMQWLDERSRLANMLAMVTGLRAGEIQGLRIQDLGQGCLYIRHSWNFMDGLKTTKNNENRIAEVPFPGIMRDLLNLAGRNPHGRGMEGFVFWAEKLADKPMEGELFLKGLRAALIQTGMSEEAAAVYTFHGWRHYFTAYMRGRVTDKVLQKQTGHKTLVMIDHYSEHTIAGERERMRAEQVDAFGALLPDSLKQSEYSVSVKRETVGGLLPEGTEYREAV